MYGGSLSAKLMIRSAYGWDLQMNHQPYLDKYQIIHDLVIDEVLAG